MAKGNMITRIAGFKDRPLIPYNELKVTWFDSWHPALDEALRTLPEMEACSHELFRLLIQNPTSVHKRIALITRQGVPIAVAGLRQRGRYSWEPVTQWIIPGAVFPAQSECLIPALEAIRSEVWVAWWRMENSPPPSRLMRYMESTPTYRMRCSDDFEQYWRKNGFFKNIRNMRNRCQDFVLTVNAPGAAEWVIKNWGAKWLDDSALGSPSLSDRILAAKYMESCGRHYTLTLLDQDTPIGGTTNTVHKNDLVAGVLYREPQYERQGVGIRLIDLVFSFAAENGFEMFDMGGGHDYKKQWAPQEGERWWFNISPEPLYRAKQVINWVRGLRGAVTNRID